MTPQARDSFLFASADYAETACAVCDRQCRPDEDGLCQECARENAALDNAWDDGWDETPATTLAVVAL